MVRRYAMKYRTYSVKFVNLVNLAKLIASHINVCCFKTVECAINSRKLVFTFVTNT